MTGDLYAMNPRGGGRDFHPPAAVVCISLHWTAEGHELGAEALFAAKGAGLDIFSYDPKVI